MNEQPSLLILEKVAKMLLDKFMYEEPRSGTLHRALWHMEYMLHSW